MDRKTIARQSMMAALRMRQAAGLPLEEAICVYDLAEGLGIEVRFVDIPSLEGMYCPELGPTILLSALRPSGRRAFTCAHELAHHDNRDGSRVHQFAAVTSGAQKDPKEFAADCFAGALLMPNMAVHRAFNLRNWNIQECTPEQVFTVANYFGVGYSTLIHHMRGALRIQTDSHAKDLLRLRPNQAQARALGWQSQDTVWIVDNHWEGRPVDAEVGDLILVRGESQFQGGCLLPSNDSVQGTLFRAHQPGTGRLFSHDDWSAFVRVSRKSFVGRSIFRHMEEGDNEQPEDHRRF